MLLTIASLESKPGLMGRMIAEQVLCMSPTLET